MQIDLGMPIMLEFSWESLKALIMSMLQEVKWFRCKKYWPTFWLWVLMEMVKYVTLIGESVRESYALERRAYFEWD